MTYFLVEQESRITYGTADFHLAFGPINIATRLGQG